MTKKSESPFYAPPVEHLEQGDIFRIDLVAPSADETQRILRTVDGQHGSHVLGDAQEGRIFGRQELDNLLARAPAAAGIPLPFLSEPDGCQEWVVVAGTLFPYFILVTQTCDISGKDGEPVPWAAILPVIALASRCKTERIPFKTSSTPITLHDFVQVQYGPHDELEAASDTEYPFLLRDLVKHWLATVETKKLRTDVERLRNFLHNYADKGYMYPLAPSEEFDVPESYVDFTAVHCVPTEKLQKLRESRLARINIPYREHFAQGFAHFLGRVAVPQPMRPRPVK